MEGIRLNKFKVFDIIGPVMVGPSSSHTAGAARLGKMARNLCAEKITEVEFKLYGSFAATYKGHGTDRALLAGIMNIEPDDYRLREAYEIADKASLKYKFTPDNTRTDIHPNTVRFEMKTEKGVCVTVEGSSIGGGNIVISEVNGIATRFTGENPILITRHNDTPGVISAITTVLYERGINIGNMKVNRIEETGDATMYMELDKSKNMKDLKVKIEQISGMKQVQVIDLEYTHA